MTFGATRFLRLRDERPELRAERLALAYSGSGRKRRYAVRHGCLVAVSDICGATQG
jgi:hypothetical protein